MDESLFRTHLTRQQIADLLAQEEEINVSVTVVDQLLKQHNFRVELPLPTISKSLKLKPPPNPILSVPSSKLKIISRPLPGAKTKVSLPALP
ncbi:MAG: hypothetical protein GDA56_10310 [Hormoscilla sp. GM7CHS1pb]|nr:hypothetical protein [Hormoscilla sp. GM7CHS1pb]